MSQGKCNAQEWCKLPSPNVPVEVGEIVSRDGFVFADLSLPKKKVNPANGNVFDASCNTEQRGAPNENRVIVNLGSMFSGVGHAGKNFLSPEISKFRPYLCFSPMDFPAAPCSGIMITTQYLIARTREPDRANIWDTGKHVHAACSARGNVRGVRAGNSNQIFCATSATATRLQCARVLTALTSQRFAMCSKAPEEQVRQRLN
jgi:hypothetical protein